MKTKRNTEDDARVLLFVLGTILILSIIGANVLLSCTTACLGVQRGSVLIWPGALIERHQQGYCHENCKQKYEAP